MCGISGIIGQNLTERDKISVRNMVNIQKHRGPDAEGVKYFENAILGHNRLSIIDINNRASQPMVCNQNRFCISFNGEIYNYLEIKKELSKFYNFKTRSDTEVLLAAWIKWKEESLEKIIGMFSFCIYDKEKRRAFFARDQFGQKPLYYTIRNKKFIFSSEIKALFYNDLIPSPNMKVWGRYLITASYDDSEQTYFKNVFQLMPGETGTFDIENGFSKKKFYRLIDKFKPNNDSIKDASTKIREMMVNSCHIHMRSDVPVGIMLSGGLDSASMLSCINSFQLNKKNIKSFSVDFGKSFSERKWIESAGKEFGIETNIESFTIKEFKDSIKPMIWHLEGPIGGLMNCALKKVMESAKEHGYKVLLDGTGPDECFGGYRNHQNMFIHALLDNNKEKLDKAVKEYMKIWNIDEFDDVVKLAKNELENLKKSFTAIDGTIAVREDALNKEIFDLDISNDNYIGDTGDLLKNNMIYYLQGSKIPRNLRMLDRLSMGYGIEIRLPFIEKNLIEYGLNINNDYYFLDGYTKGIVRSAFKNYMNNDVRLAVKRNIQAPQTVWLKDPIMVEYVEDLINSKDFKDRGIFNIKKCRELFSNFLQGDYNNSFFVWQWIVIEEWFRVFIDENSTLKQYSFK